jgi:hypothetical protein
MAIARTFIIVIFGPHVHSCGRMLLHICLRMWLRIVVSSLFSVQEEIYRKLTQYMETEILCI